MRGDCLECFNRKKCDNLNITLVEEQKEYIGDVLTVSKGIYIFSHDEYILDLSCYVHILH